MNPSYDCDEKVMINFKKFVMNLVFFCLLFGFFLGFVFVTIFYNMYVMGESEFNDKTDKGDNCDEKTESSEQIKTSD